MEMVTAIQGFGRYLRARYPHSSTAKHYLHDVEQFAQQVTKLPTAVTAEDVEVFVNTQLEAGMAGSTVNRRLSALHEFFEWVARETGAEEWPNPVQWRWQRVKEGRPLPRDASEAELARLFAQIMAPRDVAMFRLMLDVGLRVGEVAVLEVGDVSLSADGESGRLRVRGKGEQERFVWLLGETLACVEKWLAERPAVDTPALFVTRRRQAFSVRGIQERLQHYSRRAEVDISPHQLRHSFGRRMAEAAMPLTSLAALLGHAQVTTTQTYISGAALEVQADYQAAQARLQAERTASVAPPTPEPRPADDVWALAGVAPDAVPAVAAPTYPEVAPYWETLPPWLQQRLTPYLQARQQRWKASQVAHHTRVRAQTLRQIWQWLVDEADIHSFTELRQTHVQHYVEMRLAAGRSPATVNRELSELWALLRYYAARGVVISAGVFRVPRPKEGRRLPRFLSTVAYQRLEEHLWTATATGTADASLDRVWFLLLSDAGLRLSEVCDLQLGDVDLSAARLIVRAGKGNRDRSVPLSPRLQHALRHYLPQRGATALPHLLLFAQQPLKPSLIAGRLRRYGDQVQVAVSPHRLRHTLATRLLNEGMPITSLQKLLGHEYISTTLLYARVHDQTVQQDFARAYVRLHPESVSLADSFFGAATQVAPAASVPSESNCV